MSAGRAIIAAALLLGGCATPGSAPKTGAIPAAPLSAEAAVALGPLANASLPSGECGMILWTLDESRPAPVFRYIAGKNADIVIAGRLISLSRVEGAGATGYGVFERQVFSGPDGLTVKVDSRFSLGFDGGSYLERGLVSVVSPDGWKAVSPAAGIAGCRS